MTKTKTFTVEGEGSFPTDMLRYDNCWPASSDDAVALGYRQRRAVRLVTIKAEPTAGRWQSFGWKVAR